MREPVIYLLGLRLCVCGVESVVLTQAQGRTDTFLGSLPEIASAGVLFLPMEQEQENA